MTHPEFVGEKPVSLADVKAMLQHIEKRDVELGYVSTKCKEYLDSVIQLPIEQKEALYGKLVGLNLTRLKEENFIKIVDFLPMSVQELKVVLQAYPLSLPKKDQESIVAIVREFKS